MERVIIDQRTAKKNSRSRAQNQGLGSGQLRVHEQKHELTETSQRTKWRKSCINALP